MYNTISRYSISNTFVGLNLHSKKLFNKETLISKIDLWKYVLKTKCSAQSGESILIGMQILDDDYLAVCFAAAELSLKIVIVDYTRNDDFVDQTYYDPKTKILSPIDIFLHDFSKEKFQEHPKAYSKFIFFSNCSKRTYSTVDDVNFQIDDSIEFDRISKIMPSSSDILMRCTSSGTTGTPKIVEHTHEFLYKISLRNSYKFSGICMHVRNLNHGSSLAVYLLPTIISDKVKQHLFYDVDETQPFDKFVKEIKEYKDSLEYIIFPYPFMIEEFIDASIRNNIFWPNLNVQTLSYIQDKARWAIENNIIKSITSIFGSNETSGSVFESRIDKKNLDKDSTLFSQLDDFYKINLSDNGLLKVTLPVYETEIITNDIFELVDTFYKHKGRSDIIKINGEILDIKIINDLNSKNKQAYIVTDTVRNCLYLALWVNTDDAIKEEYIKFFQTNFDRVSISKSCVLDQKKFRTGIKIDNELLREYFRNYV